jgi:HEAT repeat protein
LAGGSLLVVFPLILFAGVWLVSLSVSHSYLAVVVGVLFLFLLTCDPDMGAIALGLTVVASIGQLVGGIAGGTLGLCAFLLLLVPLLVIGRGTPELPAKTTGRIVLQVVRSELTKWAPIRWLHGLLPWPVRTFNWLAEPLLDLVIRLVLAGAGRRPLSWRRFVGYAEEALLLKWVGSDLEFAHRLVRDYFALLDLVPELFDPDPVRRVAAVRKLGYQGESGIDPLGECLGDSDLGVRVAAVESIGRIASPRAMPHLEAATKDPHDAIRRAAVGAFRDRSPADRETLERWLCENPEVSILFHWLLVVVGTDQSLLPGLACEAAASAYHLLGQPIYVLVRKFAADSTNQNEYRRAVWYLAWGRFGVPPHDLDQATIEERRRLIREELEKALGHLDRAIRADAARTLGQVEGPNTRALLERALAAPESAVRAAAAEGLGNLGSRESRDALERALADREGDVCAAAASALAKLGDPAALPAMRRALAIAKHPLRWALVFDLDDSAWVRIRRAIAMLEDTSS